MEILDVVRSIGELANDGEPDSDSDKGGSWSRLTFEGVLSGRWAKQSGGKAVRVLEADESLCRLLLLLEVILRLSCSFLGFTRAGRPCLS